MAQHLQRPAPPGETVFYAAGTLQVLGTESQRRKEAQMAKLVGTGTDPLGQYGRGVVFDVPRADPQFAELVAKGYANEVDPGDHPGRDTTQIANSVVRGDALTDPTERAIADHIGGRAIDIVHTGDPDAPLGAGSPDPEQVRSHADNLAAAGNPDEYGETPEAAEYASKASTATVAEGDLATHTTLPASAGQPEGTPQYASGTQGGTDVQPADEGDDEGEGGTADEDGINATQGARDLASDKGVDLAQVQGSGEDGRITKADVEKAAGAQA